MSSGILRLLFVALAFLLAAGSAAYAQTDPTAVAQRFYDAVNRRDIAGIVALVTDDHVHEGGPCQPHPCIGKAALQQALERGVANIPTIHVLSTEVSGDTVTTRIESRPPASFIPEPLRAQGVERIVERETFEMRGDKIASVRSVPDTSDPQTAAALAFFSQAQPAALPGRAGGFAPPLSVALAAGVGLLALGLALRRPRRSLHR